MQPNGIGLPDWTVSRQFNGSAQMKGPRRHDDFAFITRHIPGLRHHKGIDRCAALYALAKGYHSLFITKLYRLDDIGTRLTAGRIDTVPQTLEQRSSENRRFYSVANHIRR